MYLREPLLVIRLVSPLHPLLCTFINLTKTQARIGRWGGRQGVLPGEHRRRRRICWAGEEIQPDRHERRWRIQDRRSCYEGSKEKERGAPQHQEEKRIFPPGRPQKNHGRDSDAGVVQGSHVCPQ